MNASPRRKVHSGNSPNNFQRRETALNARASRSRMRRPRIGWTRGLLFRGGIAAGAAAVPLSTGCAFHPARGRMLDYATAATFKHLVPLAETPGLDPALLQNAFLTPDMLVAWSNNNEPSRLRVDVTGGTLDVVYGGTTIAEQIANGVENPRIVFYECGTPGQIWGNSDYLSTLGKGAMIVGISPVAHGWSTDVDAATGKVFDYTMAGWARASAELMIKLRLGEMLAAYPQAQVFVGGHSYGPTRMTHFLLTYLKIDPKSGQHYLDFGQGQKIPVGGVISVSGYHPQINGRPQNVAALDALTGDPLLGPISWWFVAKSPESTVGAQVGHMFGGKGKYPGGPLPEYLKVWHEDELELGWTSREALHATQTGLEYAKEAARYHRDSKSRLAVLDGLGHFLLVGDNDGVIIAKGDRAARKGQRFEFGLGFGDRRTGFTYFGDLLRDLRKLTGTGDGTQLVVIPNSAHYPHERYPLLSATATEAWMESGANPLSRGFSP